VPLHVGAVGGFPDHHLRAGYTGRSHIDDGFHRERLAFNLVLSAMDADVIKTYVELGLGVASLPASPTTRRATSTCEPSMPRHLFASNMTRLALRRGAFLRGYAYDFIRTFASPLTRELVAGHSRGARHAVHIMSDGHPAGANGGVTGLGLDAGTRGASRGEAWAGSASARTLPFRSCRGGGPRRQARS
jgi:hypothetical protein